MILNGHQRVFGFFHFYHKKWFFSSTNYAFRVVPSRFTHFTSLRIYKYIYIEMFQKHLLIIILFNFFLTCAFDARDHDDWLWMVRACIVWMKILELRYIKIYISKDF